VHTKEDGMRFDESWASEHGRCTVVGWSQVDVRKLIFPIPQRENILNAMRAAWKQAQPEFKESIVEWARWSKLSN
jgi:hypothetical protein